MKRLCAILMAGTVGAGAMAADVTNEAPGAAYTDSIEVRTMTVPYEASEIRDEDSAEDLFFRIRRAAAEVCRISSFPRGYEVWYEPWARYFSVKASPTPGGGLAIVSQDITTRRAAEPPPGVVRPAPQTGPPGPAWTPPAANDAAPPSIRAAHPVREPKA